MKGIIRKTGEEITVISYGGSSDRSDVLDYVSYIDSKGVEHPREKLNPFWDVELIHPDLDLKRVQIESVKMAIEASRIGAENLPTKLELIASNILSGMVANDKEVRLDDVKRSIEIAKTILRETKAYEQNIRKLR